MGQEKLLHREQVIRFAGLMLMLSPFANILLTIASTNLAHKWTLVFFREFITGMTLVQWAMLTGNLVVGSLMIKGRRQSWMPVLVILFVFIAHGLFRYNSTEGGKTLRIATLVINIALFALVYYQEYWQITYGHLRVKFKAPLLPPDKKPIKKEGIGYATEERKSLFNISASQAKETPSPQQVETPPPETPPENPLPEVAVNESSNPNIFINEQPAPGFKLEEVAPAAAAAMEELKPSLPEAPAPTPVPPPPSVSQLPLFDLTLLIGFFLEYEDGPWAYIERATTNEIHVEIIAKVPEQINSKKVEIPLGDAGVLQFSLSNKSGSQASFRLEKIIMSESLVS
jgi:hypothetical protein